MSQQIKRQKTIDLGASPAWGKIIPLASGLAEHDLQKSMIVIGRVPTCDVVINDKRLSSKHCQIEKRGDKIFVTDLSTNGTYIKDHKIGKDVEVEIQNNTQIWLLPASRVKRAEAIGFKLELVLSKQQQEQEEERKLKNSRSKSKSKIQEQKPAEKIQEKAPQVVKPKVDSLSQSIRDQITCAFCFEIMHGPVSVQPCNHRFCGACLTQLIKNKKGDCIKCRKKLTSGVKDASFNSIIDDFLKNNPDDKRDPKDIEEMNKKNIFTFDPIDIIQLIQGKPVKKKAPQKPATSSTRGRRPVRRGSDLSASDQDEIRCRQCMTARNGFQCGAHQKHFSCFTCGKLIANREDRSLHQNCILCTQNFCNLYFPPCSRSGVKLQLLETRKGESKIDSQLLRGNKFQFESIKNFLVSKKMNSKDVFDFVMKKIGKGQFSYIVDRKIMKVAPIVSKQVKLNQDDSVCDLCWKQLWFQMVFFYRNQVNSQVPSAVKDRPICYWGINCRTMDHNSDHAKKFNHMVYQTRF